MVSEEEWIERNLTGVILQSTVTSYLTPIAMRPVLLQRFAQPIPVLGSATVPSGKAVIGCFSINASSPSEVGFDFMYTLKVSLQLAVKARRVLGRRGYHIF
jgi:hypothetical protein